MLYTNKQECVLESWVTGLHLKVTVSKSDGNEFIFSGHATCLSFYLYFTTTSTITVIVVRLGRFDGLWLHCQKL